MRLGRLTVLIFVSFLFLSGCLGLGGPGLSIDFMTGIVVDASGRLVDGATISVKPAAPDKDEEAEEKERTELTDATGTFSVKGLKDDQIYKVTVSKEGYVPQTKTIKFKKNTPTNLTFVMAYGGMTPQGFTPMPQAQRTTVAPVPYDPKSARVYVAFAQPPDQSVPQPDMALGPASGGPGASGPRTPNELAGVLYGADPMGGNLPIGATHGNPVQNLSANNLSLVDFNSNKVVAVVPLRARPYWISFHPSGKACYVADETRRIAVLSPLQNNAVVTTIGVGEALITDMAVTAAGDRLYVALRAGIPQVGVIDTASNQLVRFFPIPTNPKLPGAQPGGVAVSRDGGTLLVTMGTSTGGELLILETGGGTAVGRIPVGSMPLGVGVTPDGTRGVVANYGSASVSVVDVPGRRVTATMQTGTQPARVAMRPDGRVAYVTNNGSGTVSLIDPYSPSVLTSLPVGQNPMGVAITPDGSRVYVANNGSGTITIIDAVHNTLVGTTPPAIGSRPYGVGVRP